MANFQTRKLYFFRTIRALLYKPQARSYASKPAGQLIKTRTPLQQSMQVVMKRQMDLEPPHDVGLLPGTFIMPSGAAKPSIIWDPALRWRLEWHRLKTRLQDLRGVLAYKFTVKGRPFPKIARRKIAPTAAALHKQMYIAFVESDIPTLSAICANGLQASLKARIASRSTREFQQWVLHKYTHAPRIVSDRCGVLLNGHALRQVTVRIRSVQSLIKTVQDEQSKENVLVKGSAEEKQMDEYLVIQRRIWKSNEEPWMIWGTTQESKVEDVLNVK